MAPDLEKLISAGEIVNTCANQVHGWLRMTGADRPIYLNLTGNLCCDLIGRRITFDNRAPTLQFDAATVTRGLARQQIGPTGDIAVVNDDLILEWYSQDGHMFARIPTTQLELSERSSAFDNEFLAENCLLPMPSGRGLFREIPSLTLAPPPSKSTLDHDAQMALLDSMLQENPASQQPIRQLISPELRLPKAGSLVGDRLQRKVKEVLAHLALLGITLEMCHHFRPAQAYEMLHRMVLQDSIHPKSPQTGFIVHYLTFEHCQDCLADEETWVHEG